MNSKKATGVSPSAAGWEVRPGGMLVQQRNSDSNVNPLPTSNIRANNNIKRGSPTVSLTEHVLGRERRIFESAEMEKAAKDIAAIRAEVDSLAKQVASIEMGINGGKKFVETVILKLIELLMTKLINLDGIVADGDLKSQRKMQVKRVQMYIETLDTLKTKNACLAKRPLRTVFTMKTFQNRPQDHKNSGRVVTT